jgi:nucleoid DNA-binding protein
MSDSILALLADELDTSPEKAQKLLIAMLREVKKRARREGVRLPNFGTFRETDGQITFEPSPSLARAVNHRFEGLESEDLGTAPDPAADADEEDDGPNTITLGYQNSDWTPLDAEEEETSDDGDDTEEFQVPAAEEAADTDEFEVPDAASSTPASESEAPDKEPQTTETEELYPLVEDVPDGAGDEAEATPAEPDDPPSGTAADEEHDSLSGIWDDEGQEEPEQSETEFDPFDAEPEAASSSPSASSGASPSPPAEPAAADASSPQEIEQAPSDREPTAPDDAAPDDQDPAPSGSTNGSVGARLGVGLLAVLLLGGAAWYVLGRQGTVQPPRETIAQLTTQLQSRVDNLSAGGSSTESSEIGTPPSATAEVGTGSSPAEDAPADASDDSPAAPASSSSNEDGASPQALAPSAGGWTVIVASRTQQGPAESLVEKYRATFPERELPVGVLTSVVDGQTRYRVGVGQFDSRSGAQQLLDEAGAKLPQGAWPLRLQ